MTGTAKPAAHRLCAEVRTVVFGCLLLAQHANEPAGR